MDSVSAIVPLFPFVLFAAQLAAFVIVVVRLLPGRRRRPPVEPLLDGLRETSVTAIIPTLNEVGRLGPCLEGVLRQGAPLVEVIVVDSRSSDGTAALVGEYARRDGRIRLVNDPPLPPGWVGKVWALQHGLSLARGEWVLGLDADTEGGRGMVAGAVRAAREGGFDLVSFSPCFDGQSHFERLLQPSLLLTMVYRNGAPGAPGAVSPARLMANGQCFLVRRAVAERLGGYSAAKASLSDDVSLARHYAKAGVPAAFLDGSRLYRVRAYRSAAEMWREWGRSIDLADSTTRAAQLVDLGVLLLVQAAPFVILALATLGLLGTEDWWQRVVGLNLSLIMLHVAMRVAIMRSYARTGLAYWLSPLTDPLAVARVMASTLARRKRWRGREYQRGA